MFLVDSHCHLDKLNYNTLHKSVTDVIDQAYMKDIKLILTVSTSLKNFYTIKKMVSSIDNVLISCGIHPMHLEEHQDNFFSELQILAAEKKVIAIGETGLDYFYQQNNKLRQQNLFREQIRLGIALNKPVIVHARNAREDTLAILREEKAFKCGGVLHCFTEDLKMARALMDLGFYISLSGIITFRNAEELRRIVRFIPLDHILLETDSPYLSPVPYRGKENRPSNLRYIAEFVATLKGVSLMQLASITTKNFGRLFHIENLHFYADSS